MLEQARKQYPQARYEKVGLQEMDFHEVLDGAICMDAMEHIFPEDWPRILSRFADALKPGGLLYFNSDPLEQCETAKLQEVYERAKDMGLPVIHGEVADKVDASYEQARRASRGSPSSPVTRKTVPCTITTRRSRRFTPGSSKPALPSMKKATAAGITTSWPGRSRQIQANGSQARTSSHVPDLRGRYIPAEEATCTVVGHAKGFYESVIKAMFPSPWPNSYGQYSTSNLSPSYAPI